MRLLSLLVPAMFIAGAVVPLMPEHKPDPGYAACAIASEREFLADVDGAFTPLTLIQLQRVIDFIVSERQPVQPADRAWAGEAMGTVIVIFVRDDCVIGHATASVQAFQAIIDGRPQTDVPLE